MQPATPIEESSFMSHTPPQDFCISQKFFFDAAHTLRREIETEGSLRVHGHTYYAEVSIAGRPDAQTGMVVDLGQVRDLMSTGPQTVLVIEARPEVEGGKPVERMIPFVAAFVDGVDLPGKRITVDWQPDY